VQGSQWSGWNDGLAIAVLKGSQLRVLRFTANGNTVMADTVRITDQGRLRVAVQGPDGNMYLAQDADPGSILRVVPTP
jgi:glucose/arabinose dehydrogenase